MSVIIIYNTIVGTYFCTAEHLYGIYVLHPLQKIRTSEINSLQNLL